MHICKKLNWLKIIFELIQSILLHNLLNCFVLLVILLKIFVGLLIDQIEKEEQTVI